MKTKLNIVLLCLFLFVCLFPVFGRGAQGSQGQSGPMVSLSVEVFDRGNMPTSYGTVTDNRWTTYIKDHFARPRNIDLTYVPVPRAQEVERVNVMMASRSAPDVIFTYNWAQFHNFATQGGLTDLTALIPSNAPELQRLWGQDLLRYGQLQNRQYAIHAKRTWVAHNVSYIRKDWLDKIGVQPPTINGYLAMTPDELFNALQQAVNQNVSGRGPNNTFAWGVFGSGATATQSPWDGLRYAFYDRSTLTEEIIATQPMFLWPGTKDAFRFFNRMYNARLMDPDFALQRDHQLFMAQVANGQVGFFTATDGFGTSDIDPQSNFVHLLYQNDPTAEFVGLQLLHPQTRNPSYRYAYNPTGMIIMVPSFSRAAPQALQYLNWLAQEDLAGEVIHGVEGEHWRWANGIRVPIDTEHNANTRISLGDITIMYNGLPDLQMDLAVRLVNTNQRLRPMVQAYFDLGNTNTWTNYIFGQEITSETRYASNLLAKSQEIYTQAVMARAQDFDAVYDRLVREYLSIGGQEIIDEKIVAYRNR